MTTSSTTSQTAPAQLDLLGMQVAHRGMLADSDRFATLVLAIGAGEPCSRRRASAIGAYLRDFADSIHHHHTVEDDVLWPLIVEAVGDAVDLSELTDDHDSLDPLLDRLRALTAHFVASHRTGDPDPATAVALGTLLRDLHALLDEHIAEEERVVFPIIRAHLTPEAWASVEETARRSGKLGFEFPRFLVHTTPEEIDRALAGGGIGLRLMLSVVKATAGRAFARREAVIAGA
ncbi:MAG: hemerythrin domain-containing protein [Gordonia paraffinivorans]